MNRKTVQDAPLAATVRAKGVTVRVLIADDQADVREALRLLLKSEGFQMEAASSPSEILAALQSKDFDVVLMDLNYARDTTSGQEGLDLLTRIEALDAEVQYQPDDWDKEKHQIHKSKAAHRAGGAARRLHCPRPDQEPDHRRASDEPPGKLRPPLCRAALMLNQSSPGTPVTVPDALVGQRPCARW